MNFMKKYLVLLLCSVIVGCSSDDSEENLPCDVPITQTFNITTSGISVGWTQVNASSVTIEYGQSGFTLGSGIQATSAEVFSLNSLEPSTPYDYYLRANCGNGGTSIFAGSFTFTTASCIPPINVFAFQIEANEALVTFENQTSSNTEVEYGETGFTLGTGIVLPANSTPVALTNLSASTSYDIYVRANCGSTSVVSNVAHFTTDALCPSPTFFDGSPSSMTQGRVLLNWNANGANAWRVEYGLSGFEIGTGVIFDTSEQSVTIDGLISGEIYEFYVRGNCGSDGFGNLVGPLPIVPN